MNKIRFPTMLRKMWSGEEVQEWLDENVVPCIRVLEEKAAMHDKHYSAEQPGNLMFNEVTGLSSEADGYRIAVLEHDIEDLLIRLEQCIMALNAERGISADLLAELKGKDSE